MKRIFLPKLWTILFVLFIVNYFIVSKQDQASVCLFWIALILFEIWMEIKISNRLAKNKEMSNSDEDSTSKKVYDAAMFALKDGKGHQLEEMLTMAIKFDRPEVVAEIERAKKDWAKLK